MPVLRGWHPRVGVSVVHEPCWHCSAQDGTVTPACGQIVSFTSDASNVHSVEPVSGAGRRFAIAMWFTDVERQREPSDSSLPQRASTGTREHASATNRAPQSLLLTKQRTQSDG
eukprot:m.752473 g.752473  ORF g.752473 m.752473 type:complete len:114 (-) comp23169_c0_seq23:117-458(-)